jgi:hypothetical protein
MNVHTYDSNDRCYYQRHNQQSGEISERIPQFSNRSSGVFTGLRVTTGPGLSLNIAAGQAIVNGAFHSKSLSTLSAVNTNFNFVVLTGVGTISRVTGVSNFPGSGFFAVLAACQASGSSIIALRDLRTRIGDPYLLSPGRATAWRISVDSNGNLLTTSL